MGRRTTELEALRLAREEKRQQETTVKRPREKRHPQNQVKKIKPEADGFFFFLAGPTRRE